jgi:hypothetical protein
MEKAKHNQKLNMVDQRERIKHIDEKGRSKIEAVMAVKEAWRRDIDTYKEMK